MNTLKDKPSSGNTCNNILLAQMASRLAKIGGWRINLPDQELILSVEVRKILGLDQDCKITIDEAFSFVPPEHRTLAQQNLQQCIEFGKAVDYETELINRNGLRIPIHSICEAVFNKEGKVIAVEGAFQDISDRKVSEAALEESDKRFKSLLDEVPGIAVQGYASDGTVLYWNKASEALYGYSAEEAQGKNLLDLIIPPELKASVQSAFKEVKDGYPKFRNGELRLMRKDGSNIDVFSSLAVIKRPHSEDEYFSIDFDLSERKKLEQQFLRVQRMESIGTLAGGIAHDLNNMLAPIMMATDLIKIRIKDPETLKLVENIRTSARRGAEMVSQVLSFSRGMEGKRIKIQLRHLINDLMKILIDTFPKNIVISGHVPKDLWILEGDPTQIHQVLLNLCVNARDAMPNGGELKITAENTTIDKHYASMNVEAKPGPYLKITVEDNGEGIAPNLLDKIFDPFFTTKPLGKGTGLGLSTTFSIVQSHGGFIRVYSEQAKGSKFQIHLPALKEPGDIPVAEIEKVLPKGSGETILVVDDEASVRQITCQTLEAFGYHVLLANDGAEAVSVYAPLKHKIALVITDMMMPIMDGPATIRVLRKINPDVRIIATSGLTGIRKDSSHQEILFDHFLQKPYAADTLLRTIKQVLTKNS